MIKKILFSLSWIPTVGFTLTLIFAIIFGDVWYIWYENNMLEEFVIIVALIFVANTYRLTLNL